MGVGNITGTIFIETAKSNLDFSDSDLVLDWLIRNKHVSLSVWDVNMHHAVLKQRYITVEVIFKQVYYYAIGLVLWNFFFSSEICLMEQRVCLTSLYDRLWTFL